MRNFPTVHHREFPVYGEIPSTFTSMNTCFCNFQVRFNITHLEIQTTARAMDLYASGDSGVAEATKYLC